MAEITDPFVRFQNVQKSYDGETLVVKNLQLDIAKGEFLTLLGPSGSGKTTCLMMLAGFESPTHGEIMLDGHPIHNVPPHKRGIGMVFQNYALFPHMTVTENVGYPLKVRGIGRNEMARRVDRALTMVELGHLGGRRPAQLSGGQQQRVALARALVFEPALVLLDEPLGALDKNLREQMQYELKHIHATLGVTMVYVTHDQTEALTMSDRIAVFDDGIIQQLDEPSTLYEEPSNAFVAQFIGENNRLLGTVESVDGTDCIVQTDNGDPIRALNVRTTGPGGRTLMSLRPERISINPNPGSMPNILPAEVLEVIYVGDHIRSRMSVCGRDDFIVKVPNWAGHVHLRRGEKVEIGWFASDCRALDA
ncbi:ABC transporter ATP-binding protein [Roseospira marina]|uniref:Spermidine/putrescine import ATP-binding protein PotA n=1 Tax=Roseospira marina TaxID=140057 RepID=A0A5M6IGB7_9PROT|nr:ABC transporter ATP-binding protein [Roseospira marina]KAA5607356.1 ABC transporter ATP-binding protein [Roseospira marina]MBB4312477.1 putative spermidine/putrescine transport system ATP-binding protein [Roseospira marina]MBB5085507.1 putative spermidine/putrescine transport system ATP-binding protein [Roseospira marina]